MEFDSDRHPISPLPVQQPASTGDENEISLFVAGKEPEELPVAPTGEWESDHPDSVGKSPLEAGDHSASIAFADNRPDEGGTLAPVTLLIGEGKVAPTDFEEHFPEKVDLKDQDSPVVAFVEQPGEPSNDDSKSSGEDLAGVEPDSDIYYLNGTEKEEKVTVEIADEELESRYEGLDQLDVLLEDDKSRMVLSHFRPESLLEMQSIGWNMTEWMENGTLESLSLLLPVRVSIKPACLSNALVLLIEPHLGEGGKIELKLVPFLHHPPAIPLSEKQGKAVALGTPFWMFKRVVDPETSQEYDTKHFDLWKDLSAVFRLEPSVFDEIFQLILHAPARIEEGLKGSFWTEAKREEFVRIVDIHFPLRVAFFTGLHIIFYPLNDLTPFPAWQELIGQANSSI